MWYFEVIFIICSLFTTGVLTLIGQGFNIL